MTGTVALQGGGPFAANDDLDRRLLAEVGAEHVVVLPTADAFETPQALVEAALAWGERLEVGVEALMVFTRSEALEPDPAAVVAAARAVYLVGDSPIHLRSVLTETPLWEAVRSVVEAGGLVAGVAGSAAALCDPMTDPRGGAFAIGLGLVPGLALATETESWTEERLHRTLKLADDLTDVALAEVPTGSALIRRAAGWELVGDVTIHGDLSA
jgi:cyanophycinase